MSKRSLLICRVVLLTICFAAARSNAAPPQRVSQPVPGRDPAISGRIIVPISGFWDRIEVVLEYETGAPVGITYTDPTGYYAFYNLQPGRYFVIVELDGFETVRERADVSSRELPLVRPIFLTAENKSKSSGAVGVVNVELRRKYSKKAVDEYDKAREDMASGDLQKAVQRLVAALKEAPSFFEARNLLGSVYHRMRRYSDAELEYRKAHELDPQAVPPLINIGMLYIEAAEAERDPAAATKLYTGAYDALVDATKLDSRSAMAELLLGAASYKSSRNDEAETHLKRALDLNRNLGQAHIMLANLYIRQQKWESALQSLNAYLRDHEDAEDARQVKETRSKVAERVNASRK